MSKFLHNAMPSGSKKGAFTEAQDRFVRDFTSLDRFTDEGSATPTNRARIDRQKLLTCTKFLLC